MLDNKCILERVQSLDSCDLSSHSVDELRQRNLDIRFVRAWLDSLQHQVVMAMSKAESVMAEVELIRESGMSATDVRQVMSRAETLESMPTFGEALSGGRVTSAHVDALSGGIKMLGGQASRLTDRAPELLLTAQTMTPDEFNKFVRNTAQALTDDWGVGMFEKQRRRTHLRHWIDAEGMTNIFGKFDPERGSIVTALLDQAVEVMFHSGDSEVAIDCDRDIESNDHRRAIALVALLQQDSRGAVASGQQRPARAEIIVHIDLETLRDGLNLDPKNTICRTPSGAQLTVETIRRLACEADIIPLVLGGTSVPLDVGKAKRLATVHQRRALAGVHETCAIDGCTVKFSHCEPHHINYWENGGDTNLDNLVPLCSRHHHAAHEGGWKLKLDPKSRQLAVQR